MFVVCGGFLGEERDKSCFVVVLEEFGDPRGVVGYKMMLKEDPVLGSTWVWIFASQILAPKL